MPELPEVENVVRSLRQAIVGARIRNLDLRFQSVFKNQDAADFLLAQGAEIRNIRRAGKYILFDLERRRARSGRLRRGLQLMVHLGMTGKLLVVPPESERERHTHAVWQLSNGMELRYVDPRRFGRIALSERNSDAGNAEMGIASGHEPLEVDEPTFVSLFFGRKGPIKSALLNQKLLRGMGNIYADESLFRAGIHPLARCVSRPRLRRLRTAIQEVLREAIEAGGSSISDYVDSEGRRGWFQVRHRVYDREAQPCVQCAAPIRRIVISGRSAHYCAACQKR